MKIEQIYTGCLAQGAYYIESDGEAAIIDPLRETAPYLDRAKKNNAKIKYILETHFHADFVSGHLDLAKKSEGTIVFGPTANPKFDCHIAKDGEEIKVGKVTIKVLHTPGHTMESTTYLLKDESDRDHAIFSGDTLFLGDVGRPDLAQKATHMTKEDLAGLLYDSLRSKIMTLADDVTVYPAHGAGSACGKNMMKETVDTLGNQKKMNYALRADMTKAEFVKEVTDGLLSSPAYFPENVRLNKEGYESIDAILGRGLRALAPKEFEMAANETGALILDTREAQEFAKGFIPNSINIGIDGNFAPWVGALIPGVSHPLLMVSPEGREEEVVTRLARVGYDHSLGYLKGGITAWEATGMDMDTIESVSAEEFVKRTKEAEAKVIDVRNLTEYAAEHVDNAINLPLDFINEHPEEFTKDEKFYIHCASGYRSMVAASILKARGWDNFVEIAGGIKAISEAGIPLTDYVCPTTLQK